MKKKNMNAWGYTLVKPIVKLLFYTLYRPTIKGRENIPKNGPFVLAGNHTKWLDSVMLVSVTPKNQVHFLAKEELWHGKGWIVVKAMGCIPVNRKIHDKDALIKAYEYLNNGSCIGIFPEGTINRTDDIIMPFKFGAVKMCKETDATLVPFVITGKYKLFKKGVTIEFLKPRKVTGDLELENEKLMSDVKEKLEDYFLITGEKKVDMKRGKKNGKK
ncbi:MAG: 1-acyl-sn-glycerol-3-phosphate acyltransferase [Bacilli bacterium]|nr:1-acyl-sn-glycerol-3-phosphate acyltransferase [Bacilli bacterium]